MKITTENLKDQKVESGNTGISHFQSMLDRHIQMARANGTKESLPGESCLSGGRDSATGNFGDWINNISMLKDVDDEYYKKASKKQDLAENFDVRFGMKVEERIKKFTPLIESKAKKYDLDPNLLAGLVKQESNFNPYAVSHCGAMGLGQLMPQTARYLGVKDPFNAAQNLEGAAKYLKEQLDTFGGNVDKALAAYNAGPGAVKKYGGIPPYKETQNYVVSIRSHRKVMEKSGYFAQKEVPESEEGF
jgi:soluble lytic murein transglycosylase-like protein